MLVPTTALSAATDGSHAEGTAWRVLAPWRMLVAAAALSLLLSAATWQAFGGAGSSPARLGHLSGAQAAAHRSLSSLPVTAQGPISRALGAAEPAYRVSASSAGLRAWSPAAHMSASFSDSGVLVGAGTARAGLRLGAVGYGASLHSAGMATAQAQANRVSYAYRGLSEWFANGPLGLEQGFTIPAPLGAQAAGPLTLAMSISGNVHASLASSDRTLILSSGASSLRYGNLLATDANGRTLPTWLTLRGREVLLNVDARGARYPLSIDPLIQQGAKLTGSEAVGPGSLGYSVALSSDGNTALIGGPEDNTDVGAAWVFTRSGSTWTQQGAKLTAKSEEEVGPGSFGLSVALSPEGNFAVIGGFDDNAGTGAAWVFTRSGSTWTQQGEKLTAKSGEESAGGFFGSSVAINAEGNTALIGGFFDTGGTGAAWVFTREGSKWTQQGEKLTAKSGEEAEGGFFGLSTALSADGDTALIGAPHDGVYGSAWVFTRSGTTWAQQGEKLTAKSGEESEGASFGFNVALSSEGNTALVGAPEDSSATGAAWVFTRTGSAWTQQGEKLTAKSGEESEGGAFGTGVALSPQGNTALIAAPRDAAGLGAAWVFTRTGSTWTQQGEKLTAKSGEESEGGAFGTAVALSSEGTTALIGAPGDGAGVGAGWVFASPAEAAGVVALLSSTVDVSRNGQAAVMLSCTGSAKACSGKLTLSTTTSVGSGRRKHTVTVTIATTSGSIASGKNTTVKLQLNSAGRELLSAGHGKLTASLTIVKTSPPPVQEQHDSVNLVALAR